LQCENDTEQEPGQLVDDSGNQIVDIIVDNSFANHGVNTIANNPGLSCIMR